ncbi:hypothetical protein ACHAXT_001753 [Thalassiosira profunda]
MPTTVDDAVGSGAAPAGAPMDLDQKPAAKKSTATSGALRRAAKTSVAYKTDLDSKEQQLAHPSGIIHASKSSSSKEEHCFAWLDNVHDGQSTQAVVERLGESGFKPSGMRFVPFSSKGAWVARYPHAVPCLECGLDGRIAGTVPAAEEGNRKKKSKGKPAKKAAKAPPKFLTSGSLPDLERTELHRDIYSYLTWLHSELLNMETNPIGRRKVQTAGVSVPALRGLLGKMESAFRGLKPEVGAAPQPFPGAQQPGGGINPFAITGPGGMAGGMAQGVPTDANGMPVPALPPQMQPPGIPALPGTLSRELPFLERALESELRGRVVQHRPELAMEETGEAKPGRVKEAPWRRLEFDYLFDQLVAFQAEKGHCSPPAKHPELGKWVAEMRLRKKALRTKGLEWESDEDEAMAAVEGGVKTEGSNKANVRLTKDRVARLDSVEFPWTLLKPRKTWEQHFSELQQFRAREGRAPTNKEGGLGNWLKTQRKLYSKRDADFMESKAAKFEAIGVPLRTRHYAAQSWEDRFQQLVEFGRVNRHFDVANPVPDGADPPDANTEAAEAVRFYKFVKRLHTEYRALQRGGGTGNFLTPDRVEQLRAIGFQFNAKPEKEVPTLDWATRVSQLEAFHSEMGHMHVDPNYDKFSNLGGWAVEVSERHRAWQEGREYLSPEMVERFNQLNSMGFGFDVFRTRRGERSWEESFNLLLQYRAENGSCRVPHHYKADFRLGSWVAVQRKEYKALTEGKKSKMTQEKIRQLESLGFEWVATRGHQD